MQQGSGQPAGGDVSRRQARCLQTRRRGHGGGWLSWESEAGMDELGIAAPPCGLGPGPNLAGRWGQGRRGEKLGVG